MESTRAISEVPQSVACPLVLEPNLHYHRRLTCWTGAVDEVSSVDGTFETMREGAVANEEGGVAVDL